jgi:hypothetical protein
VELPTPNVPMMCAGTERTAIVAGNDLIEQPGMTSTA